ncbi:uncharacterized protein LOC124131620 isoform X2 [Haliotis rufescens]|uniref:uncharacterized protein LOC124131620 isoform X2 n=1 Tax=Haliotis rufescens TaxID=6454 RepID=UPI001EB02415|nr:uncharacterized protein LOC124131620 isoform X2 [Haliotis rufescens]XP_046350962.1 uncharacterized protein LOC124131620 isoform X2 [Haliotis rufescens]
MAGMEMKMLQFETNEEDYPMPEFFDRYSKKMPIFAIVTQGCLGLNDLETFAAEQPLFCHNYEKQRRVVARDSRGRTISIPEEYPIKFKIVISRNKVGPEQTMKQILLENKLPVQVRFAAPSNIAFYVGSDRQKAKDLSNLALSHIYEETYILANGVYGRSVDMSVLVVPLYLSDLHVSTVKGVVGMGEEEWKTMYAQLKQSLKDVKIPPSLGNNEIAVFSESSVVDKEDHIYSYIEPSEYITFSLLSQDKATDDDATSYSHKRHPPKGAMVTELQRKLKITGTEDKPQKTSVTKITKSVSTTSQDTSCRPKLPSRSSSFSEDASAINVSQVQGTVSDDVPVPKLPPRRGSIKQVPNHLKDLTIEGFSKALKELKLVKYISKFQNQQVDGLLAHEFTMDVLKSDFKFTGFESVKLMKFIKTGHIPKD